MAQQVFTVNGMTCDGCERRVTTALGGLSGVSHASADHLEGTVSLSLDVAVTDMNSVRGAIEDLGYEVVTG